MSDSQASNSPVDMLESQGPTTDDQAFSPRQILPSGRALLLLVIPLAMLEFYLHLIWVGRIANDGYKPPVSTTEHIVYGCIVYYPILILVTMFVKALYYFVRAASRTITGRGR